MPFNSWPENTRNKGADELTLSRIDTSQLSESEMSAIDELTRSGQYDFKDPQLSYYLKENGINGLRVFLLATEYPEVADDALRLARTLNGPHVRDLFAACAGLLDAAKSANAYARETFSKKLTEEQEIRSQRLLRDKAAELVTRAAKQMPNESIEQLMNWPERAQQVMRNITKVAQSESAKARLFATVFKLLKQEGEIPLEEIRDASFEEISGDEISSEDAEAIVRIQAEQYQDKYPEPMLKELRENLIAALKSQSTKFYLFRKSGEIVTYVRFDQLHASGDSDKKHMASFMTNPSYEGGALGQTMLKAALKREIQKGAVYAECDQNLVPFYERFGFALLRLETEAINGKEIATAYIALGPEAGALREAA